MASVGSLDGARRVRQIHSRCASGRCLRGIFGGCVSQQTSVRYEIHVLVLGTNMFGFPSRTFHSTLGTPHDLVDCFSQRLLFRRKAVMSREQEPQLVLRDGPVGGIEQLDEGRGDRVTLVSLVQTKVGLDRSESEGTRPTRPQVEGTDDRGARLPSLPRSARPAGRRSERGRGCPPQTLLDERDASYELGSSRCPLLCTHGGEGGACED